MSQNLLSFSYVYKDGIFRPVIEIMISNKIKVTNPFEALVDSGSDKNLFPAEIGESIGLIFDKNNFKILYGIGGVKIKAYTKKITLHVYRFSFETFVDFSYEQGTALLGRHGFFSLFKSIKFKEDERFLDIELKDD